MIQTMKRGLALLMALVMCIGFLPMLQINTSAASVEYVYDGKYVYNWGTRGTEATFLSPMAEEFYENDTYDELSELKGGTNKDTAPASALYAALQKLMADNHTTITSYDGTRDLYQYTDCQNSGKNSKAISCFYSGKDLGPEWDKGATWNREHTWPNSKGEGSSEDDIMMLRPTASNVNSSRGNKPYGESSGYYNPNSASNNQYDLRGDVARIFLYVYVRWGQTTGVGEYTIWGSNGIIESLDILLAWMAADPVDTWELGRNDSVESITGTRNVFVDYPEYAFLLFGAEIPADMTTPSGENNAKCAHNNYDAGVVNNPTCTLKGYTLYTCQTAGCGDTYRDNFVPAKGHSYVEGVCSVCGAQEPAAPVTPNGPTYVTEFEVGKAYKLGLFSTDKNAAYYFTGTMSGYYGATSTDSSKGVDVFVENATGGYHLYFMNGSTKQYINLVISGTYYNFTFDATATSVFTWDAAKSSFYTTVGTETCYIGTYNEHVTMGVLRTSILKPTDYIARLYVSDNQQGGGTGGETPTPPVTPSEPAYVSEFEVGKAYKLGLFSTAKNAEYYFTGTMSGYYGATDTDYSKGVDVFVENATGGYHLYFMNGSTKQYINLVYSNSHYNFTFDTTATSVFTWDAAKSSFYTTVGTETCYIGTYGNYVTMGVLRMSEWSNDNYVARLYVSDTQQGGNGGEEDNSCAKGHSYVDGVCSKCGAVKPAAASTATISFADKANRTEFTTSKQVWKQNGITVTNNKAGSSSSIGDYGDPARFYKSSSVTIEFPGMAKIVFDCDSSAYATSLKNSLSALSGATVSTDGKVLTLTLANATDSITFVLSDGQVRMDGITVYGAPKCDHTNTVTDEAIAPTCTAEGHTAKVRCIDCETVIDEGNVIPARGHRYVNNVCSVCNAVGYTVFFVVPNGATPVDSVVYDPSGNAVTLPTASAIDGYLFLGWTTGVVNNVTEKPEYLKAEDSFTTSADTVLYALYSYEKGGESSTIESNATISFANKAQRTTFNTSKQVWEQNGITVTNDKAGSSSNVGDYANPARFYANSQLIVAHPGMTKIEFTCNSSSYATALKNSISAASGVSVSVSSSKVTVTFTTAKDSFTIAKLSAQVRVNSIKVYYTENTSSGGTVYYTTVIGEGACAHAETTLGEGLNPTCTTSGYANTLVCAKCEAELASGQFLNALGHDVVKHEAKAPNCTDIGWEAYEDCSRCDYTTYSEIEAEGHDLIQHEGRVASCTDGGWEAYETCSKCSYTTYTVIDANGHYLILHEGKQPTCSEKGWEAYESCSDCNYTTYKELAPAAHTLTKHEAKAATCTEKGWEAYETCSKCDHTTYKEIAAKGHAWEAQAAVDPTCTTEGIVAHDKCKACGATSVANVTVPKVDHTLKHVEAKAATTEAEGNVEYWQCEDCGGVWTDSACSASSSLEDVVVPKLEAPVEPDDPKDPDDDEPKDPDDEPKKEGFFARIWNAIANFFNNLFGKKKN